MGPDVLNDQSLTRTPKNLTGSISPYTITSSDPPFSPTPEPNKDNTFKYNCHTRSDIIKRSKKYKQTAKMQKKARRNNRTKK